MSNSATMPFPARLKTHLKLDPVLLLIVGAVIAMSTFIVHEREIAIKFKLGEIVESVSIEIEVSRHLASRASWVLADWIRIANAHVSNRLVDRCSEDGLRPIKSSEKYIGFSASDCARRMCMPVEPRMVTPLLPLAL